MTLTLILSFVATAVLYLVTIKQMFHENYADNTWNKDQLIDLEHMYKIATHVCALLSYDQLIDLEHIIKPNRDYSKFMVTIKQRGHKILSGQHLKQRASDSP